MEQIAYLSLGSNIGQREHFLSRAIEQLEDTKKIQVVDFSSIYETDPVGYKDQSNFLNMVIEIRTELTPEQLLNESLMIEKKLGRKREIRFGPRTIDIDVLLYNQELIHTDRLIVPHPRMHERSFVLIPLVEINGSLYLPNIDVSVKKQMEIVGAEGVRIWRKKQSVNVYDLFKN
ncbi:2-amino-4-hydroxy-6-hydroxymethyldihydropteridine diphosphokinase [Fervidibacillus halotolerans]|uniref:2-amino-4-hydroxy-6-hydroxymethyldihydropteridine diphosphokinase n=1 Tax=Fervidibacillus halotolerans TaxID=2980027 RepID=A0A9E8S084_9BACI|nr:2-amino-4-hydroxy-6-hydroxymethyldihydropteridine diphosphokinase [Fervidibacillus halotolerans]WAA12362.1 2-amino-4-hydroxy-6-hydroxymethyldihydropteridine diphosphokinase [Fervidibacillus halotolerans]